MSVTKGDIRNWLDSISDDEAEEIAIGDDGISLVCVNAPDLYLIIGFEDNHVCDDGCRSNGCSRKLGRKER